MEEHGLQWQKLTIKVNNQAQPAVENILVEAGSLGNQLVTIQPAKRVAVIGYFDENEKLTEKLAEIKRKVIALKDFGLDPGSVQLQLGQVDETSWAHQWEKYYHVQHISRFLTIVPRWQDYQARDQREIIMRLDPGKSFGTGMHPTTVLALHQLEFLLSPGASVFDVGAGSGILSIAASLFGAGRTAAFENDLAALQAAKRNLQLNPAAQAVTFQRSDLLAAASGKADLLLANILPEVLLRLIPTAKQYLQLNGRFILSGINLAKRELIIQTLNANGFLIENCSQMGDWCALVAKINQD